MPALIYIHGFLSSPASYKARQLEAWLQKNRPDIQYYCPQLTPYPEAARDLLESLLTRLLPQTVYLVGSSLGGYWCTYLAEKYNLAAVLINPSVRPYEMMPNYLDQPIKNYHSDRIYTLTAKHIDEIKAVEVTQLKRPDRYWVMLQAGDEVLDYRCAAAKYAACKQLLEVGGDHSFQDFDRHIPAIIDFLHNAHQ